MMRLELKDLSFSFAEKLVLKGVSMDVADGEFLGLMGPNGSGKTTLLRCITNFLPGWDGKILVDGKPMVSYTPRSLAKVFAEVPQISSTDFPFTAYDIVMMGRIPHIGSRLEGETRKDMEIVRTSMKRTNTLQFAERHFSELSGGERQRVIIARALAQQPKVLLLDEPTVYLDISGQFEMMDLIRGLNKEERITTVTVLHDINMAARYCDRIALLNEGRLEAIGTPEEVLTQENIQSIYGLDVSVRKDPFTHSVYVMPRSARAPPKRHGARVHVLCGGGTGGPLMRALVENGYSVSTGVLNVLDSDYENATDLRVPVVAEAPFSQIGPESHGENLRMIDDSQVVIVLPFPVGPGNLKNLEAARYAVERGKRVYVFRAGREVAYDFVGGRAESFISALTSSGAMEVRSLAQVLTEISRLGGAASA